MSAYAANTGVPSAIKCNRCNIVKNPEAFSKVRLETLKERMRKGGSAFDPRKHQHISCTKCTGSQVIELKCYMCGITKDRDKFAKTQRRNPDRAHCFPCQQEKQNIPTNDDSCSEYDSEGDLSEPLSDDDYSDSITRGTTSLSLSDAGTYAAPGSSTRGSSGGVSLYGGSSNTGPGRVTNTRVQSAAATSTPPSFRSTPSSARSTASSQIVMSSSNTSGGGKFAKVRAVQRPVMHHEASKAQQRKGGTRAGSTRVGGDDTDSDDVEIQSDPDSDDE